MDLDQHSKVCGLPSMALLAPSWRCFIIPQHRVLEQRLSLQQLQSPLEPWLYFYFTPADTHRSKQLEAVLVTSRSRPSSAQISAWSLSFWQDSSSHEVSHSQCLSDIYNLSPQKGRNFPLPPSLNSIYKHFETSHEGRHTTYTSSR